MTVVAIDGPAGAGKSTVARAVAGRIGGVYLDSGAMYRAVALAAQRRGINPEAAADVARTISIELLPGGGVLLDGEEVTGLIRDPAVSEGASAVAAVPEVRAAMVEQQRALLGSGGEWVAEGRDIGTVVWPQAEVKVYLTASPEVRAERRAAELGLPVADVLAQIAERDGRDTTREHSPLRAAPDAVTLDTTGLSLDEVVGRVAALVDAVRA
ncbi:MAG TPA: (d)CMP kinase [Solirubrobacteraceae bacterium]|nr:(d)CMP kinase [Solirubrobacteraceae bacterium]